MKVSYLWLKEYLEGPVPTPEEVAELLTFGAFEVEGVVASGGDTIIDVKVLPNRAADCLSHRGIAKELATLAPHLSFVHDPYQSTMPVQTSTSALTVHVENKERCPRYIGVLLKGVKTGPSPQWLKDRLEALGQRSINNVVDSTNYVMLETGQPMHAFDAKKLSCKDGALKIAVRQAKEGERIVSLSGEDYSLVHDDLVITDENADVPVGIAGVKGGIHAEVTLDADTLLLEAANFSWDTVRRTSTRHRLATDASQRFAGNLSPQLPPIAMARAIRLLQDIAGGEVVGSVDTCTAPAPLRSVDISLKKIQSVLGFPITHAEVAKVFDRMQLTVSASDGIWEVTPPFERTDLTLPEDIIEEIGRISGYGHIQGVPLPNASQPAVIHPEHAFERLIRASLIAQGFSEVKTSIFVSEKEGEMALLNPLAEDRPRLRHRIGKPGLARALEKNWRNAPLIGGDGIRIFEIGGVFSGDGTEAIHLSLGVEAGKKKKNELLLQEAREAVETALGQTLIEVPVSKDGVREFVVSKTIASLDAPSQYEKIGTKDSHVRYSPISTYPFALRDIAVWAPFGVTSEVIASRIDSAAGALMVRRELFDEFKRDDQISFAFHLVFQADDRTLTDAEVNEYMQRVEEAVKRSGWTVR